MRTFAQKQSQPQQKSSACLTRSNRLPTAASQSANPLLHLQRTIGNQATLRLLQARANRPEAASDTDVSPITEIRSETPTATRFAHDFSLIPVYAPVPITIQRKLAVNTPGDIYEQEADYISEQVMCMPEPKLQRACACGGGCPSCQTKQPSRGHQRLQAKHVDSSDSGQTVAPPIVSEVLGSPGQPLDTATRSFFEPRFGHDFSHVRVHTDGRAGDSARAVNALAYTSGRHLVFGVGQYSPTTASGRRLLAHELAHSIQQRFSGSQPGGEFGNALQRWEDIAVPVPDFPGSPEVPSLRSVYSGPESEDLANSILVLVDKKVTTYVAYRDLISKSTPTEKRFALHPVILSALRKALDYKSLARCAELLGRRAPTFDELRKNSTVSEAINDAWRASDVGINDRVLQAHEEGGWVFMNLIDGSLSIERAKPVGTDFIIVEPPPQVEDSVLVAIFHTHPDLGPVGMPSRHDRREDSRRGVPNLVAGNTGNKPDVFQVRLSGPSVRKHLASEYGIPGPTGGEAP